MAEQDEIFFEKVSPITEEEICIVCKENVADSICESCGEIETNCCTKCFVNHPDRGKGVIGYIFADDLDNEGMMICGMCVDNDDLSEALKHLRSEIRMLKEHNYSRAMLKPWIDAINGSMSQSYKPIVCLALFELAKPKISKDEFVNRVSEFFFHLENQFTLNHGPVQNEIHMTILGLMNSSEKNMKWKQLKGQLDILTKSGRITPREAIWRKLCEMPLEKLPPKKDGYRPPLYHVEKDHIKIPSGSLQVIQANRNSLMKFAKCVLGEFLEKHNSSSPRINQKISVAWNKGSRPNLKPYMAEIIYNFEAPLNCYICKEKILGTPELDHVIPFSHIGGHDIWNLMPSCGANSDNMNNCNQVKSSRLPTDYEITLTEQRNARMLLWLKSSSSDQLGKATLKNGIGNLEFSIQNNELRRLWNSMR